MARLSTIRLTSTRTYDPDDCATVGWDVTLYSDGHLAAQRRDCWQGSTSGERWVTDPGRVDYREPDDPETTADDQAHVEMIASLERFIDDDEDGPTDDCGWRQTRKGYVVR